MEENRKVTSLKVITVIFILISLFHLVYATMTWRGLYEDGAFYAVSVLNALADGEYKIIWDSEHPRFVSLALMQFPLWILNFLGISGKKILLTVFSFIQFFLPISVLFWNYSLTKRTGKTSVFFFHLFSYCVLILPFSIFSVVESIIGFGTHFVLWNYLVSDIKYKKSDIIGILFCLLCFFGTYEYILFIGIFFFLFHFAYVIKPGNFKGRLIKTLIGLTSLCAVIFNIKFMLGVKGEEGEIERFLIESINWLPGSLSLCSLYSYIAIIFVCLFTFKRKPVNHFVVIIIAVIFLSAGGYLFINPQLSVYPMWEQHMRALPCVFFPLFFLIMHFTDRFENCEKYKNLICIVLICGIMQNAHQIIDTYYWDKNVKYMKTALAQVDEAIFIPSEHEIIGDFHTETLRRFLWHGVYPATSILFSDSYKQKTLLLSYDTMQDEGNPEGREFLYLTKDNRLSVPFGAKLNLKNKYWDLTDCAYALDKYNKENNIHTYED